MIYLAQPVYLLLLFLIPLLFIFYALMRRLRKKRVARLGDPSLIEKLLPYVPVRKGWVKLILLSLSLFFFAMGMARPQIGAVLKKKEIKGAEIMVVLDVSNSMLAQDYSPNRLERAKLAVSKLVDDLHGDRIGLIIFAGESFVQLPVTSDYVSAKIFLNTITTESVPVQGTALGEAIRTAARSFTSESEGSRAIILITDGENHEDDPVQAAEDATSVGARVFCIGVGSPEGKPIPMKEGGLMEDAQGNIVVTRLDEGTLQQVAQAGGGVYVRAGNTDFGFDPIISRIRDLEEKEFNSVVFEEYDEQYMYFFIIALFFLLLEFFMSDIRNRRSLFVLAFLLCSPLMMQAQTDKTQVRDGNKDFNKGDFRQAEVNYKKALDVDSTSLIAKYNLTNALYRSGGYNEAELYARGIGDSLKVRSSSMASDYYHNSGNLAMKLEKYQEAVDAYKESLRLKPDDMETKANLAYAQQMLRNQQQQQQNPNQQQDQQDQDQNQDQNQEDQQQQDQQDQNKDQQDQQQDRQQQEQPNISPQAAQQMLQAIEDKEKQTQDKVRKAKAEQQKSKKKEKNW